MKNPLRKTEPLQTDNSNPEEVFPAVIRVTIRTRKLVRALFASFVIDIILTAGIGYAVSQNRNQAHTQAKQACLNKNYARTTNEQEFDSFFKDLGDVLLANPQLTPTEITATHRFINNLETRFNMDYERRFSLAKC